MAEHCGLRRQRKAGSDRGMCGCSILQDDSCMKKQALDNVFEMLVWGTDMRYLLPHTYQLVHLKLAGSD